MPHVTKEQLLDLLPMGDSIHTFIDGPLGAMLIGADWSREKVVNAIERADRFGITGDMGRGMGHGIYCQHPDNEDLVIFVATRGKLYGGIEPNWQAYEFEGEH